MCVCVCVCVCSWLYNELHVLQKLHIFTSLLFSFFFLDGVGKQEEIMVLRERKINKYLNYTHHV